MEIQGTEASLLLLLVAVLKVHISKFQKLPGQVCTASERQKPQVNTPFSSPALLAT